jgi:glycosyltransferase involved in cell wall biosynthesis
MIDIVTINLNNKKGLEHTIKSVLTQTFANEINYVIIDGGSTDGSVDVIKKYKDYIDYCVSEPDNGIFNAFNKALSHLKGDYVLFLNSGDYLASETIIEGASKYLGEHDILYGNLIVFNEKGNHIKSREIAYCKEKLDESFFRRTAMPHQASFIRTDYQKQHPYDETYKIAGDWKFFREAIMKNKCTYSTIPFAISYYGLDGISSKNYKQFRQEVSDYYKKEFPT